MFHTSFTTIQIDICLTYLYWQRHLIDETMDLESWIIGYLTKAVFCFNPAIDQSQ